MAGTWLRALFSLLLFVAGMYLAFHHHTVQYLCRQGWGQMQVLFSVKSTADYAASTPLSKRERDNLALIETLKRYAADSLGFEPTNNYTTVFDGNEAGLLWVITASEPYRLKAYEWEFPLVGRVNYKGFFNKALAQAEYNHLVCQGYDVDLRSVTAWSTLGWFSDPVLPSMLRRTRGSLCNLLFHELFHATVYYPSQVDLNENLASFVAHKATLQFLRNDSLALREYLQRENEVQRFNAFMLRQAQQLDSLYGRLAHNPQRFLLKQKYLLSICDSLKSLVGEDSARYQSKRKFILSSKNAAFIDLRQYDGLQDSLDKVFNKFYGRNIKKLVQDLKLNRINS